MMKYGNDFWEKGKKKEMKLGGYGDMGRQVGSVCEYGDTFLSSLRR